MQDKQKVTLYLPPDLHRQMKIKAAVEAEPMSTIAERALTFYMEHSEIVEELENAVCGTTHQVYACPECASSVVLRSDELVSLKSQDVLLSDDALSVATVAAEPLVPMNV
jgi:hypothetical protein